jgi:hypothetical protein
MLFSEYGLVRRCTEFATADAAHTEFSTKLCNRHIRKPMAELVSGFVKQRLQVLALPVVCSFGAAVPIRG